LRIAASGCSQRPYGLVHQAKLPKYLFAALPDDRLRKSIAVLDASRSSIQIVDGGNDAMQDGYVRV